MSAHEKTKTRARACTVRSCGAAFALMLTACGGGDPASSQRTGGSGAAGALAPQAGSGGLGAGGTSAGGSGGTGGTGTASGGTGGSGSAGTGATLPAPNADSLLESGCATATVESALLPTHLLFVLDRSGSMACNPPPTTESAACEADPVRENASAPSKWEIVQDAMQSVLQTLPPDVSVGISYFSNDDACGVHPTPAVAVRPLGDAQLAVIETSLAGVTPGGGTPIVGATILAYQHLHTEALAGRLLGNSFVVLLTDGEQSEQCTDEDRCKSASECTDLLVGEEAVKARMPGVDIRTFVIGAPGSEPARGVLGQLALAGGTAPDGCDPDAGGCHFDMTQQSDFAQALGDALAEITGQAATCELPVPTSDEELELDLLNVVYSPGDGGTPSLIVQDARSACDAGANGWQYSADGTKILLCGPICDTVRGDRGSRVDVVIGCPVQGPE